MDQHIPSKQNFGRHWIIQNSRLLEKQHAINGQQIRRILKQNLKSTKMIQNNHDY